MKKSSVFVRILVICTLLSAISPLHAVPTLEAKMAAAPVKEQSVEEAPVAQAQAVPASASRTSTASGRQFTQTFYVSADTYVCSIAPDTNYGAASYLRVGRVLAPPDDCRILVRFDLDELPENAEVVAATLELYSDTASGGVRAHAALGGWKELVVTWNNKPDASVDSVGASSAGAGWQRWNVKDFVQDWVDGTLTYNGFMMIQDNTVFGQIDYQAFATGNPYPPRLVVTYQTVGSPMMLPVVMDTWINEEFPSTNYGTSDYLRVRYDGFGIDTKARTLLWFDTSYLPSNITVVSATLDVYSMINRALAAELTAPLAADLYPDTIRSEWDEMSVTWNSKPVAYGDDPPSTYQPGWLQLDVTTAAQGWVSGTLTNYGIQLRIYDAAGAVADFMASPSQFAPRLTIYYEPLQPVCDPVTSVAISGPTAGNTGTSYDFEAQITPLDATGPFTYTWTATDQSQVVHVTSNPTDTVAYSWPVTGTKTVNVTVENCGGSVSDSHQVTLAEPLPTCPAPLTGLLFFGTAQGTVGDGYSFRATASPKTATTPVTFTWQADGQSPVTVSGTALQSTQVFTWNTLGPKAITVTATNCGTANTFVRYHTIDIVELWELPDLDVSTAWYDRLEQRIGLLLHNTGGSTAFAGHIATLDQGESVPDENIAFPYTLAPGAIREAYFDVPRSCSSTSEPMQICADTTDRVVEGDETNNCWQMTLPCDMDAPVITSGPTVMTTTETTATLVWETNEPCSSNVRYDSSSVYYRESEVTGGYTTDHQVTLSGLTPGGWYHFNVLVTDMGDTSVESEEGFFETQSPGTDPPVITYLNTGVYPDDYYDLYVIQTAVDDIVGLDRIEFTYDGVLVKTEYFYPSHSVYANAIFSPHALGYTRDTFFDVGHTVEVRAINLNGTEDSETQIHTPPPTPKHIKAEIVTPSHGETIYMPSDPIPAGQVLDVVVRTGKFEWGCTYSAFSDKLPAGVPAVDCDDVDSSVFLIDLKLNGSTFGYMPGTDDYEHTFHIDLEDKNTGTYDLALTVYGDLTAAASITHTIELVVGTQNLSLERTVTRVDNYFEVELTIANAADATLSMKINQLWDQVNGFQVINKTTQPGLLAPIAASGYYIVDQYSIVSTSPSRMIKIDFFSGDDDYITLAPGDSYTVNYVVLPELHETLIDYDIGDDGTFVHTTIDSQMLYAPSGNLNDAVADAFRECDYLIVTNPNQLAYHYGNSAPVKKVLSDMARLAQLKRGALGYLSTYNDKHVFDDLVEPSGHWSMSMYPDFWHVRKGYMLIVGESEIVKAWDYTNVSIAWGTLRDVPYSDHRYADTKGGGAPDLIVGRIIGNTPVHLSNAMRTSINVTMGAWDFDRTNALLTSGTGDYVGRFEDNVKDLKDDLEEDGWNVVKLHWNDEVYLFPISFAQDFGEYDGFAAGDVIAGGKAEMVIAQCTGDHFVIRDIAGNTVGGFDRSFDAGDALAVGDVMGDSAAEIIVGDFSEATIYIYGAGGGTPLGSIPCDFEAFDGLATGYVKNTSKQQIIFADASEGHITVYDPSGTPYINFIAPFNAHDGLAAGNVITSSTETALDEILVGHGDKIYIYDDLDGAPRGYVDIDHNFEAGDRLAAGNILDSSTQRPDEIVIGDRNDYIYVYAANGHQYSAVNTREFEYYDGLAVADVTGDGLEEVLMADRDDLIKLVDTDYPLAALEAFKANTAGQDLLVFRGHGNTTVWSPALYASDFPLNFNNTKPFVFATSCLTGKYGSNSDTGIAESFLNNGAVGYVGATQVSPSEENAEATFWFFDHWDSDESVGSAFTQLERAAWGWFDWGYDLYEYWVYEYNLYGDPKMGTDGTVLPSLSQIQLASPEAPVAVRDVHVPMYEVSLVDGADYVEIPGGQHIPAMGQYAIPYWIESINYRPGTVVRDVTLVSRSGLTVTAGLSLPLTNLEYDGYETRATTVPTLAEDAWFPESEMTHDWYVTEGEDGDVILNIAVYPFFYNPGTQDARFYRDFTFDIQLITTGVSIQAVDTNQGTYVQGDPVSVTLVISNAGSTQDVIVDATIKADPDAPVAGLPLRNLHDLSGLAEAVFTWDSTGILAGDYFVEIRLRNVAGDVLDLQTQEFTLGITDGEVTALTATPEMFTVGDSIAIAMTFANIGTVPITGTAVIQVYPVDVMTATATFTHAIANLLPGGSVVLNDTWDTTGATADAYRIVGYVNFNSMASAPKDVFVSSRAYIYLPLVLRNH